MPKNIKTLLTQATAFPAALEAKLPEGAPKVSTMLLDATGKLPDVPDLPVEVPDLPAPPTLPELPGLPGAPAGLRQYVTGVEVRSSPLPLAGAGGGSWPVTPVAAAGVVGQGHTVRDYA